MEEDWRSVFGAGAYKESLWNCLEIKRRKKLVLPFGLALSYSTTVEQVKQKKKQNPCQPGCLALFDRPTIQPISW
jgi:hypothetical protein